MRISLGWAFRERGKLWQEATRVDKVMDGTAGMNLVTLARVELREVIQRTAQHLKQVRLPFLIYRGGDVRRGDGADLEFIIYLGTCQIFWKNIYIGKNIWNSVMLTVKIPF